MKDQAIASCRVSTAEQRIEGHSLERQEGSVQRAATELGVEVVKSWSLDRSSKSGKNVGRKDLLEMLEYCKHNKRVKYLIVDEVDRFMRSIDEFYYWEVEFRKYGVAVYYASQPALNTPDMAGKFSKLIEVFKAESSNVERQRKSTNGLRDRVAMGYSPFNTHVGYVKSDIPGLHQPDPLRFEPLRTAISEVRSGLYSPAEALRRLISGGFLMPSGKPPHLQELMKVLRNNYYAGIVEVPSFGLRVTGLHPAMITEDDFNELQSVLDRKNAKFKRKQHNPEFPLSKMMTCKECTAGRFTGSYQSNGKGNRYAKYRCRGCGRQYHQREVHASLGLMLDHIELSPKGIASFIAALDQVWRQKQAGNLAHARALQLQLDQLKPTKSRLVLAMVGANGAINPDIEEELNNVKKRMSQFEEEIAKTKDSQKDLIQFVEFAIKFVLQLKDNWWHLKPEDQLVCQQMLFPAGITFNADKEVGTPKLSEIMAIARQNNNIKDPDEASESLMVELPGIAPGSVRLLAYGTTGLVYLHVLALSL